MSRTLGAWRGETRQRINSRGRKEADLKLHAISKEIIGDSPWTPCCCCCVGHAVVVGVHVVFLYPKSALCVGPFSFLGLFAFDVTWGSQLLRADNYWYCTRLPCVCVAYV